MMMGVRSYTDPNLAPKNEMKIERVSPVGQGCETSSSFLLLPVAVRTMVDGEFWQRRSVSHGLGQVATIQTPCGIAFAFAHVAQLRNVRRQGKPGRNLNPFLFDAIRDPNLAIHGAELLSVRNSTCSSAFVLTPLLEEEVAMTQATALARHRTPRGR